MKFINKIAMIVILFAGFACSDDDDPVVINNVITKLSYPEGIEVKEGIIVKARSTDSGTEFELKTNAEGSVTFQLPVGNYEFSATETRTNGGKLTAYNSMVSKTIANDWNETSVVGLTMEGSTKSQLIIKELYSGGCATNDGNNSYGKDPYITLYNNSPETVDLQNLCFGMVWKNSYNLGSDIKEGDTRPYWFKEDWTPASIGYFYFPNTTTLEPYSEIVVAINGAIDHTQTHSNSVDLSIPEYYAMYDKEKFGHRLYYPAPSANVPASHYLKAGKYGMGTAWLVPGSCPNVFIFYPEGQTPEQYAADKTNLDFMMDSEWFPRKKVPASWTLDAIEGFAAGRESENVKRINPKVDAGYTYLVSDKGYSIYRNVDKEATEAIEGNKDKLVYSYSMGTKGIETKHGSTDPSKIDAEASIANGAKIIYKDTNNSSNDFHLRKQAAIKK